MQATSTSESNRPAIYICITTFITGRMAKLDFVIPYLWGFHKKEILRKPWHFGSDHA